MEPQDLVTVYLAPDTFKADLIKNMLAEEGIRAVVETQVPALFEGSLMVDVKVLVENSRAAEARQLIEEREDRVIDDALKETENETENENESESEPPAP